MSKSANSPLFDEAAPIVQRLKACQRSAFAAQRKLTPDANQAAETALASCATEESELASVVSKNPYFQTGKLISSLRAQAKAEMITQ